MIEAPSRRGTSLDRPRLDTRISAAAAHRVVALVAGAGYGKTFAIEQYLARRPGLHARLSLVSDHADPLRFARDLQAVQDTLAGRDGTVVLDNVHLAQDAAESMRTLSNAIGATTGRTRWLISSRHRDGLPLATWLGYGIAAVAIGEDELRFTFDETAEALRSVRSGVSDEEARTIHDLTRGWPVAVGFAQNAYAGDASPRAVAAQTRTLTFEFLKEQTLDLLDPDEKALLEVGALLPAIDVRVLEGAGFERAAQVAERLSRRGILVPDEAAGRYRCDALLGDCLQDRLAVETPHTRRHRFEAAASALERSGDADRALALYARAKARPDVLRLLERSGFDLLERACVEEIRNALDVLDERTKSEHPVVLALRGLVRGIDGKATRCEDLLTRALRRAQTLEDKDSIARIALRLALHRANRGQDVTDVLLPIAEDATQDLTHRTEALSLLASHQSLYGKRDEASRYAAEAEQCLLALTDDRVKVKVLQRLGIALLKSGEERRARALLQEAAEASEELEMYTVASRSFAQLSNMALLIDDDIDSHLRYIERVVVAARKAGSLPDVRIALIQMLGAHVRLGNSGEFDALCTQLGGDVNPPESLYVSHHKAIRLGWDGEFAQGHKLLATTWHNFVAPADSWLSASLCALYLALDGLRSEAISVLIASAAPPDMPSTKLGRRNAALGCVFRASADAMSRRFSLADRTLRNIPRNEDDLVISQILEVGHLLVRLSRGPSADVDRRMRAACASLRKERYGGIARLVESIAERAAAQVESSSDAVLTTAERMVLTLFAEGYSSKEVATRTGRSIHTVRAHVANAVGKLGCSGRTEAIAIARRLGIIA